MNCFIQVTYYMGAKTARNPLKSAERAFDVGDGQAHHVVEVAIDGANEHAAAYALDAVGPALSMGSPLAT